MPTTSWKRFYRVRTSRPACWTPALKVRNVHSQTSNFMGNADAQPVWITITQSILSCYLTIRESSGELWGNYCVSFQSSHSAQCLKKGGYCQYMIIFRLPSNWLLIMTGFLQQAVGALCTDCCNCVCFRGGLASFCWSWRKYRPWKPSPSYQVRAIDCYTHLL